MGPVCPDPHVALDRSTSMHLILGFFLQNSIQLSLLVLESVIVYYAKCMQRTKFLLTKTKIFLKFHIPAVKNALIQITKATLSIYLIVECFQ